MIPHSRPYLPDDYAEVTARLRPGWVAGGPCVRAFEEGAAGWMGSRCGVATSSGTSALLLALRALGVGPGDQVLIPTYVCAAVMSAVHQAGAEPMLVDAEPGGVNLDPADARRRLGRRCGAIVAAHMFGCPADLTALLELGPPVIEDCAQCFGGSDSGGPLGARGAAAIASFFATKVITTGQGGLACSPDPVVAERLRDLAEYDGREDYRPRLSVGMSELDAALGLWQLERLPAMLARRRALAERYRQAWRDLPIEILSVPEAAFPYRFIFRVPDGHALMARLRDLGVGARPPVYRPLHSYVGGSCPHADRAHRETVSVPLYPALSDGEAEQVIQAVREVLAA